MAIKMACTSCRDACMDLYEAERGPYNARSEAWRATEGRKLGAVLDSLVSLLDALEDAVHYSGDALAARKDGGDQPLS